MGDINCAHKDGVDNAFCADSNEIAIFHKTGLQIYRGTNMSKILTIIVPTYNRKELLAKGLRALIPQVENHRDDVDLYVSDNCSDDGTQEIIKELQAQHPGLIAYKRQPSNLGAQGNFLDAVKSVNSKFVAIFSDDDCVLPGYIDTILKALEEHPDIALINYNGLQVSAIGSFIGVRDPMCAMGCAKYYASGRKFIKEHTHYPSLVSSNVILREEFEKSQALIDGDKYPGYGWFAAMMFAVADLPCLYIDTPVFLMNCPASQRWEHNAPLFYVVGLSRLFKELDLNGSGIWESWRDVFRSTWFENYCLNRIAKYKKEYKDRYRLLLEWSPSTEFSCKLKYYLFYPSWYRYIALQIIPRAMRRINTIFRYS